MNELRPSIINGISSVIAGALARQKSEEHTASYASQDNSESLIAAKKEEVANLRRIRNELEDIFAAPY